MLTETLFTNSQDIEITECLSTDKWIKKNVVYIHNGILFILKKERKPDNCDCINEPGRHYKWNKKKREGKKL